MARASHDCVIGRNGIESEGFRATVRAHLDQTIPKSEMENLDQATAMLVQHIGSTVALGYDGAENGGPQAVAELLRTLGLEPSWYAGLLAAVIPDLQISTMPDRRPFFGFQRQPPEAAPWLSSLLDDLGCICGGHRHGGDGSRSGGAGVGG
jgi:hypothetical protein